MASTSTPSPELGPLLRLWGIRRDQLPPATASGDALVPFLTSIMQEAVPFIDAAAPKSSSPSKEQGLWKPKGTKSHRDSDAPVEVSERRIPAAALRRILDLHNKREEKEKGKGEGEGERDVENGDPVVPSGGEMWCCRRSVHADEPRSGTASYAEFDRCFRLEHAESEAAFTPNVRAVNEAVRWDCEGVRLAIPEPGPGDGDGDGDGSTVTWWGDFRLVVEEMRHHVGTGLNDRTFPVLQVSCVAVPPAGGGGGGGGGVEGAPEPEPEFFFISIPVPDFGEDKERSKLASKPGALVAVYVSVERVRTLPGGGRGVEWLMATASDARGVLPAWVQNMAMPAVIWKDVPLFLGWIAKERERGKGKGVDKGPEGKAAAGV
ncbi:hypothetical protein MGN70_005708 [Eutypa lata]|nr:hypothetical protein MGN70_005708 [Eutypa lata]